jgi:hypothetical protein
LGGTRKEIMMPWWIEYKTVDGLRTPVDPVRAVQSEMRPENSWGPYDCRECAELCGNFGTTERAARDFVHGAPEQAYWVFAGG